MFHELAACDELRLLVKKDSSLKGKTRKEVGLKKFEEVDIRSTIMGIDVVITQRTIAKILSNLNFGRFVVGTKVNSP